MKKFFAEFKTFITRGNVMDMAVGVIVGGAFTAIVNALSNNILKPIINWLLAVIFGSDSLAGIMTYLKTAYTVDEAGNRIIDTANSIFIDWGTFINAIISFLLTAFVLFCIVKMFNRLNSGKVGKYDKADVEAMKAQGIKLTDKEAVEKYFADKAATEEAAKAAAEEAARLERLANPTTEDLLKEILAAIKK